MKFYNRKNELKALNQWWKEDNSHLIVVYGKRRVGKTALCLEFAKDKSHFYYLCERIDPKLQLKKISREIALFFKDDFISSVGFDDWEQLFQYIASKKKKFVFIIDEFPYLAESEPGISSIFQKGWDLYLSKSPVFLILNGSSIGMMEKYVLDYKAPLYGRRTGQIFVEPFKYHDFNEMFPDLSFEKKLLIYSMVGGTITYIKPFISCKNIWDIVEEKILTKESFLYEEIEFLLREELREPRNYFSILQSMSLGKRKLSEIINDTGMDKSSISSYISILSNLHIVKKEIPITEKIPEKSKKGLYSISDNYFNFWFKYLFRNKSLLESGKVKVVLELIKASIHELLSKNYELVAREIIDLNFAKDYQVTGMWRDKEKEIDLVALENTKKNILLGEVKWSNKQVGTNIYLDLIEKSKHVDWFNKSRTEKYILFSKSGFTIDMISLSEKEKVILVEKDDFLN